MNTEPVLEIKGLSVSFRIQDQYHPAVDHLDLTVNPNEVLAVVGESGCGKSALALSIPQLHDMERTRVEGKVFLKERT